MIYEIGGGVCEGFPGGAGRASIHRHDFLAATHIRYPGQACIIASRAGRGGWG
jgi:hypothetical protein